MEITQTLYRLAERINWGVNTVFPKNPKSAFIDLYKYHLDTQAKGEVSQIATKEHYETGLAHFEYLKSHGLRPHHRLLDYGCGYLRLGVHAYPYLGDNYVGVDISSERISLAKQQTGMTPNLIVVKDCYLENVPGDFDFVWAKSVLTHMPPSDIKALLLSLPDHMKEGGKFFFTFNPNYPGFFKRKVVDYYYSHDEILKMFDGYYVYFPEWRMNDGDYMGVATL